MIRKLSCIAILIGFISCQQEQASDSLFSLMDNAEIGIDFENNLESTNAFNVYKYRNFYNGGGVAIGDINNDGLVDVYLVSNQDSNKLFLNKGDFQFEDITAISATGGKKAWATGVTMVDINADGLLDIYVCNSGDIEGDNKENELFINQGNLKFEEQAESYNLNDKGFSTHASFFDYDKDGDLDVYLLNNSYQAIGSFNLRKNERPIRDNYGGDKLMKNENGVFKDVSEAAGVYGSVIGFGLGVTVSDFNNDEWPDIFVSNDFFERDYLYINQHDGTFEEDLVNQINSISAASMGADAADIDNDGYTDLFVTDMLPYEYERLKTVTTFDDWNRFQYNLKNGYHNQFTRNVLQKNNGNNTFSEISRYAGVEASDWSWGALFFDMDNDGLKDLFIANGIYKDLTNQDYLQYIANETVVKSIIDEKGINYKELVDIIPSNPVKNQAYKNLDGAQFEINQSSGLMAPSFSNGSAYGDLDNDGDLDLIVNNVNMPCFFYRNNLASPKANYVKFDLKGSGDNPFGVGASIKIKNGADIIHYENYPARGFQSSIDTRPNIGVGDAKTVDIEVHWTSGNKSVLKKVEVNQVIVVRESDASKLVNETTPIMSPFTKGKSKVDYFKAENNYVDFNRERLIYNQRSNEGGRIAKGDLNGDGLIDLVFPGAKSFETEIHFNQGGNTFAIKSGSKTLQMLAESEHVKAILLDVDSDGDLDIYLASGGVELSGYSEYLKDHLLINDGKGNFELSKDKLASASKKMSTGAVAFADIEGDGDQDIFIGERIKIGEFGAKGSGYILVNDGNGNFEFQDNSPESIFHKIGMCTDASFTDIDGDGDSDLLVVGEFMDIKLFLNEEGEFKASKLESDISLSGWWNVLHLSDLDGDGDQDLIAGNLGENSRFRASVDKPIKLYFSDFDKNGFPEGIMTFEAEDGKDYPFALRHTLLEQLKRLRKRFPDFESFKDADISSIFTDEELSKAEVSITDQLKTVVLMNEGNLNFKSIDLPNEVQFSSIYSIDSADFDRDGDIDIVFGGNLFGVVPEAGMYDGSFGQFIENLGSGSYRYLPIDKAEQKVKEIRDFEILDNLLMIQSSKDSLKTYTF